MTEPPSDDTGASRRLGAPRGRYPWLWLGTWSMAGEGFGPADLRESARLLEIAFEGGLRQFDTADIYAHGHSERLVAKFLRGRREEVSISTKGGLAWRGRRVVHAGSPEALTEAVEASLERLETDHIDLYQLHWPDPAVPIADSLGGLEELRRRGLIVRWGVGNLTAAEVNSLIAPGARVPHQVHFNPIHRADDVLGAGHMGARCHNHVVSALEQGLLGGGRGSRGLRALGKRDLRRRNAAFSAPTVQRWVARFQELAADSRLSRVWATLGWVLSQDAVDGLVVGPRTPAQLTELLELATRVGRVLADARPQLRQLFSPDLWTHLDGFERLSSN